MKPKSIGIIGGAGPQAGIFFLQRLINLSSSEYGCYKDADFPKIFLINFPFSEMLEGEINTKSLHQELASCIKQLRNNGASVLAIACNTLHAFLEENEQFSDLIHLPDMTKTAIKESEVPVIFCTSTSAKFGLHKKFFPCVYPDFQTQTQVDEIIDETLRGFDKKLLTEKLQKLIDTQNSNTIVLGCTELSLFTPDLSLLNKQIIDPLEIAVKKLLNLSFFK